MSKGIQPQGTRPIHEAPFDGNPNVATMVSIDLDAVHSEDMVTFFDRTES